MMMYNKTSQDRLFPLIGNKSNAASRMLQASYSVENISDYHKRNQRVLPYERLGGIANKD